MPAYARRQIVDESVVGVYHCVARCVRRAFLCGVDRYSGQNFDHRKIWIRKRLEELAGIVAVDVLGFSVMSNHLHVMLRIRPDVAAGWSDEEVARRWWRLHPGQRNEDGTPAEPQAHEVAMLMADRDALATRRKRLSSLSWFMAALCEPIARRANREDKVTGRFWEGRFKSQAVLDEAAALACSMYIDLNPIRAGLADTPEASEFTGAFERIAAQRHACGAKAAACGSDSARAQCRPHESVRCLPVPARRADDWLSPIPASGLLPLGAVGDLRPSPHRASQQGFLPLDLDEYLELLDWTGRQIRSDKRGAIPAGLQPILERLQINVEGWVQTVTHLGRRFHRAIGRPPSLAARAAGSGKRWLHGISASRAVFS